MIHHIRSIDKDSYEFGSMQASITEHVETFLSEKEELFKEIVIYDFRYQPNMDSIAIAICWSPVKKKTTGDILKDLPDSKLISEDTKKQVVEDSMQEASRILMATFHVLGLKTHMEGKVVEQTTGEEFLLIFRKIAPKPEDDLYKPSDGIVLD